MLLPDQDTDVYETKWRAAQHHTDIVVTQRKDRTLRACVFFYGTLAQKHGVRLSALVAHILGWVRNRHKTDPNAYEYDPCEKFGEALGVSRWQIYRLLKEAKAAGLLDYRKSLNQTKIWVTDEKLFSLDAEDRFEYDRDLASATIEGEDGKLGLNASILYAKIAYHTLHPEPGDLPGYRASYFRFVKKFPWMTEAGVKSDLQKLKKRGLLSWHHQSCHFTSHCYIALKLKKPLEGEGVVDTVRRSLNFKQDLTPSQMTRKVAKVRRRREMSLDEMDDLG